METANNTPEDGIQLEEWADLPEIGENEGDDQSIDSLIQVMEYGKSISYNRGVLFLLLFKQLLAKFLPSLPLA